MYDLYQIYTSCLCRIRNKLTMVEPSYQLAQKLFNKPETKLTKTTVSPSRGIIIITSFTVALILLRLLLLLAFPAPRP